MEIEYIYRPPSEMVSIEKCFDAIIGSMSRQKEVKISKSYVKSLWIWPFTLAYNIIQYAFKSRRHRVFHITGDVQYLGCLMNPKNTIMTIHDCVSLHNASASFLYRRLVYYLWYYFPLKHLKYICCISRETYRDVLSFFPWAEPKLIIIPSPVSDQFNYKERSFNETCPRILHIGTRENKNLMRVIYALKGVKCHLRIIGKLTEEIFSIMKSIGIEYSNDYNISEEQIVQEYVDSDIVSFPSLFEGFGLPIVEAQAVGRPVVTSNIEPMRTIGRGAVFVDPYSIESIRDGFLSVITNKDIREKCVSDGLRNCKNYSSEKVSEMYFLQYNKMMAER